IDYSDDDQDSPPNTLIMPAASTTDGNVSVLVDQYFDTYGIRYDERFLPADPLTAYSTFNDPISNKAYRNENTVEAGGFSAKLDWGLARDVQGKLIFSYREYDATYVNDPDVSPIGLANSWGVFDHDQVTAEL